MPAKINLPAFLEDRLRDATHEPAVRKALQEFGKWFDESKQTFFPDYTNHGIQHIEQVLATVANLIPETAEPAFSKDDAAALILAVLLHDSALHLSKAGFWNLIKGPDQYAHLPFFDRAGWGQTWADFMFLARRWDDAMLANVFGKDETGAPRAQVRDPFEHWQNLTETDNLLIGEFIRKHHPRLAHEMALYGVPGTTGAYLTLNDLPPQWRDLAGLVARSHGLPLRSGLDYLKKTPHFGTFAHRDYRNVHAVYLMALLRVGDYIQIQGDRTSERVFEYKDIRSLVSQVEHKAHLSDIIITDKTDDLESLQIDAYPQEVAVFLRLKEWLAGIQQELDSSWAVLGEVYSLQPKLKNLGLTFRRVRSNLDDVAEFAKTVPYVPDRIRFDVARAELLKLLIGPLYGDDPSYGVRELMQNSIDAVREYDQFVLDNPQYAGVSRREQEADVVVELGPFDEEKSYAVMTISDRGIGMAEATIRDYFLRAGASYRQNSHWKTMFEIDDLGVVKSKVLRSGRFGVGALAAFLIGSTIDVKTKHISASVGYAFKTNLGNKTIVLIKNTDLKVGTVITVNVSKEEYEKLVSSKESKVRPKNWDWYCFAYPTLIRKFSDAKNRNIVEANRGGVNLQIGGWRRISSELPYDVYWTFNPAPRLTCNGIFISDSTAGGGITDEASNHWSPRRWSQGRRYMESIMAYPNLSIIDPDGKLPLNLQRNQLRNDDKPFARELVRDMVQEMLASIYFNGPEYITDPKLAEMSLHPWIERGIGEFVCCKQGYGLQLQTLLHGQPIEYALYYSSSAIKFSLSKDAFVFSSKIRWFGSGVCAKFDFIPTKNTRNYPAKRQFLYHSDFVKIDVGSEMLWKEGHFRGLPHLFVEWQKAGLLLATDSPHRLRTAVVVNNYDTDELDERSKREEHPYDQDSAREMPLLEEEVYPAGYIINVTSKPWLLDELWQEHFGKNWIPFALEDRIAKFPKAAQFFKERYPQVVPDEAWALLGGKPAEGK
ncbi:ATP-binding protein [Hymenobacter sp. M29]|uniref:ATP-binding protein n=1 Tax=Hymenobacter mellowenesis TaxID=3063995 RepID=A0ABT9A9P3_9BACT|nr:ATP-binding protein [Hymenobacter sp. M29]MDO7846556.1 ATP-binding protein [Hymenobacter sp. M29]